jgi:hypothetical protein
MRVRHFEINFQQSNRQFIIDFEKVVDFIEERKGNGKVNPV